MISHFFTLIKQGASYMGVQVWRKGASAAAHVSVAMIELGKGFLTRLVKENWLPSNLTTALATRLSTAAGKIVDAATLLKTSVKSMWQQGTKVPPQVADAAGDVMGEVGEVAFVNGWKVADQRAIITTAMDNGIPQSVELWKVMRENGAEARVLQEAFDAWEKSITQAITKGGTEGAALAKSSWKRLGVALAAVGGIGACLYWIASEDEPNDIDKKFTEGRVLTPGDQRDGAFDAVPTDGITPIDTTNIPGGDVFDPTGPGSLPVCDAALMRPWQALRVASRESGVRVEGIIAIAWAVNPAVAPDLQRAYNFAKTMVGGFE